MYSYSDNQIVNNFDFIFFKESFLALFLALFCCAPWFIYAFNIVNQIKILLPPEMLQIITTKIIKAYHCHLR